MPTFLPAELTVDEAAEMLNVSRAHLLDEIASGAIPRHRSAAQQLPDLSDVIASRDSIDTQADQALDAMTLEAEDAGLC